MDKEKLKKQFSKTIIHQTVYDTDKLLDALIEARDIAKEFVGAYDSAGFSDEYLRKIDKIVESWET